MGDQEPKCNGGPCYYEKPDTDWGCGMWLIFLMLATTCMNSCEDTKRLEKMDDRLERVERKLNEEKKLEKPVQQGKSEEEK